MELIVIGSLLVIALFVILCIYIMFSKATSNANKVIIDDRVLHESSEVAYDSKLDTFLCQLSAMWVEKDYLEHHFLACFNKGREKEANEKTIKLLKDYFSIDDKESFENKLEDCLTNLHLSELSKFVQFVANQKILNKGNDDGMVEQIMAEYQHSKIITQFYNLKDSTSESSQAYFILFDVSMAAFILRLSVYAGYCTEEVFAKYRKQIFERHAQTSIDWQDYYKHWLLADLFYAGFSFHSPYSINLRGVQKRVNSLVFS